MHVGSSAIRETRQVSSADAYTSLVCICQILMSSQVRPGQHWVVYGRTLHSRCQSTRPYGPANAVISLSRGGGGARRDRTDDLMLAKHALYQLSYGPIGHISVGISRHGYSREMVGPGRLELPTSRLSGVCSNQLSYRPLKRSVQARSP